MVTFPFEYRKLGDFMYHLLEEPDQIKSYLTKWILREWELDHNEAPDEHWTVAWMKALPKMEFRLEVMPPDNICPNAELMSGEEFRRSLENRANEREESVLRGISIEPLLVNQAGFELMDGYTRYTVLKRLKQKEVYVYLGTVGHA